MLFLATILTPSHLAVMEDKLSPLRAAVILHPCWHPTSCTYPHPAVMAVIFSPLRPVVLLHPCWRPSSTLPTCGAGGSWLMGGGGGVPKGELMPSNKCWEFLTYFCRVTPQRVNFKKFPTLRHASVFSFASMRRWRVNVNRDAGAQHCKYRLYEQHLKPIGRGSKKNLPSACKIVERTHHASKSNKVYFCRDKGDTTYSFQRTMHGCTKLLQGNHDPISAGQQTARWSLVGSRQVRNISSVLSVLTPFPFDDVTFLTFGSLDNILGYALIIIN